jgi:Zn-dependent protease
MVSSQSGSFRFFRFAGVQVYVHWSWFLVAWLEISTRRHIYSAAIWNVAEYLGLFLIVLLHEFGHVLACRQTGGVANEIVLWPLGGVAFGKPPPRPGAELWTVAAGPLVNVVLWPVLLVALWASNNFGLSERVPDFGKLIFMLWFINRLLLFFNILPIFPLDGGQILRSLLWFQLGRARSLHLAASIGLIGVAALGGYGLWKRPDSVLWIAVLAVVLGSQCLAAIRQARALLALETLPRRPGFSCPACHASPPAVSVWSCGSCGNQFDAFATRAICPHCQTAMGRVRCIDCGAEHPLERWETSPRSRARDDSPVIDV